MPDSLGVAVLASGSGTNLQAIIEQLHEDPGSGVEVVRIIGSRAGIGALARAERHRILTAVQPAGTQSGAWLLGELDACGARLVVLAGWDVEDIARAYFREFRTHQCAGAAFEHVDAVVVGVSVERRGAAGRDLEVPDGEVPGAIPLPDQHTLDAVGFVVAIIVLDRNSFPVQFAECAVLPVYRAHCRLRCDRNPKWGLTSYWTPSVGGFPDW